MILPPLGNPLEAKNATVGRTFHSAWNATATFSASASVACIVSHAVGSKRAIIETEIKRRKQSMGAGPKIDVRKANSANTATIGASKATEVYDIVFVNFDKNHSTEVKRVENRGKALVNACVVLEYGTLDSWSGEPANLGLPIDGRPGDGGCAILVQKRGYDKIVAAIGLPFNS